MRNSKEIIELLRSKGADINLEAINTILISKGADINAETIIYLNILII